MTNLRNALSTLRDSLSGADLAALRSEVVEAIESGDLPYLAGKVAAAHPPTKDYPETYTRADWEAALRELADGDG
jgi:hypothetical protein